MRLHRVAPGAAAGTLAPALPLATPSLRRHGGHGAAPQRAARQAL
ncbi:hypothetical protein ACFW6C_19375 [Streptomyces fungicidicus]